MTAEMVPYDQNATDVREAMSALFDPDMDFRKLLGETHQRTHTFRLVEKDELMGVPHIIVGVTYRTGYVNPQTGEKGDYVSLEAVVADPVTLGLPPIVQNLPDPLTIFPNEPVVYNDGGTGIRRDMTRFLEDSGLIEVGAGKKDDNPYDRSYQIWTEGADQATYGITSFKDGRPFRYLATRGLRVSEYENEYGPGKTYYFA